MKKYRILGLVFLLVVVLDQLTKYLAFRDMWDVDVFGLSWLRLETVTNTGIAFSINISGVLWWVLFAVVIFIVYKTFYPLFDWKKRPEQIAAGLLIGGAFGNIIDRVLRGSVIDYIKVGWWPTFNIADSAICVAVAVLLIFCRIKKKI